MHIWYYTVCVVLREILSVVAGAFLNIFFYLPITYFSTYSARDHKYVSWEYFCLGCLPARIMLAK